MPTEKKRVVVTGIGAVAPNGIGKEDFWNNLKKGVNCINRISFFDPSNHASQMAAEITNFNPEDYLLPKVIKETDRSAHLSIAATKFALADSNFEINESNSSKVSIILGSAAAGIPYMESEVKKYYEFGAKKIHPFCTIASFGGSLPSRVAIYFGIKGTNITISNGCTSSNDAFGYAFNMIRFGLSDVIITGASDGCITPFVVAGFNKIGALSTRNHEPQKACRPFCKDRDGFVIGEGAWTLIFEELEHALNRNASIYAEVVGYGSTCDAYHMTIPMPSTEETANAMRIALNDAQVKPSQIDYINAHGTSTPLNDKHETMAIKKVFEKHAYSLSVGSIKSMIGHAIGAAGAGSFASTCMSIKEDFMPPTINYENPDPECDLDYIPNEGREKEIKYALCNSIGFGAKNSCILLKKYQ